ncbi:MoaD/ThiS family protein [Actinopolyspora erythraea]|nr:MoaD/ThiS family protein [Actinopolyspora erythraea]
MMDDRQETQLVPPEHAEPPKAGSAAETRISVRVRYFAGARAAAGVAEETLGVAPATAGEAVSANDVIRAVLAAHDEPLARVVGACGFLLDGVAVRDGTAVVPDGAEFDVLPPFAGG